MICFSELILCHVLGMLLFFMLLYKLYGVILVVQLDMLQQNYSLGVNLFTPSN